MAGNESTRWANAGPTPKPEAMRDHLLFSLLQDGQPLPEENLTLLADSGVSFPGDCFGLLEVEVVAVDAYSCIRGLGHASYSEAHLIVNIQDRLQQDIGDAAGIYVFKVQSEIMILVCGDSPEAANALEQEAAARALALEAHIGGIRLFVNVSSVCRGIRSLKDCHEEIRQLKDYRPLRLNIDPVLSAEALKIPVNYPLQPADIRKEQEALSLFKAGRFRDASAVIADLFAAEYLALANPLILLKHKCALYLDSLCRAAAEAADANIAEDLCRLAPETRILNVTTYPGLQAQMEHIFGQLNDLVLSHRSAAGAGWVTEVKEYIRSRYADPGLNVNSLADEFGKNPSYLSRSFLRMTGGSIPDYIHHYRIQEAKILIGRGEPLSAVAETVGYGSVLTMSRAFKKYEGTTPGRLRGGELGI